MLEKFTKLLGQFGCTRTEYFTAHQIKGGTYFEIIFSKVIRNSLVVVYYQYTLFLLLVI